MHKVGHSIRITNTTEPFTHDHKIISVRIEALHTLDAKTTTTTNTTFFFSCSSRPLSDHHHYHYTV